MTEDREAPDSRPDADGPERSTVDDADGTDVDPDADADPDPDADADPDPDSPLDDMTADDFPATDAVVPGVSPSSGPRDRPWLESDADGEAADAGEGVDDAGATVEGTAPSGEATPGAAADGATVGDRAAGAAGGVGDFGRPGPEEDVEMPLTDHIEEMMSRLGVIFLIGGVVTLAVFPMAEDLINYLWNTHIPGAATIADRRPRLYGPLELLLTKLKVAALAGLLAGLPVLVYQSYRFMRPGLYPRERRYYLAAVPTSLVLGIVGVSFAHFVVLPAIFAYFTSYTTGTALVAFGLRETFNLILLLMGYMAVVFQIPLFIMLGIMMGLVTRRWLESKRLLFWGAFLGISFLVSPDPTGMAPIIVTVTMITLYEGTLALLRWTGN